ncbi:MAG: hypothetical protein HOH95_10120 [Dehalococcoidia bacterium]|nr:hypothetical protein [Dehalococcoidia bacterium]
MDPITSLLRDADAGDQLALTVAAMMDSGLILFSRDSDGRYVQLSQQLADEVGLRAQRGDAMPRNMLVFDEEGRLLAGSEYPASITRTTGKPQRSVRRRLVSEDGRSTWLQMSTMPLERGSGGWSVLTVAADVTDLQDELVALRAETVAQRSVLRLATAVAGRTVTFEEAVELLREPAAALVPEMNVGLGRQVGDEFEAVMIHQSYGTPRPGDHGRFQEAQRQRWSDRVAHVNQDVKDTDIYGASVVTEIPTKVRALVTAPLVGLPDGELAALWVHSEQPHGFSEAQIEGLELIGRLLGSSMASGGTELAEGGEELAQGGKGLAQAS